MRVRKDDRRCRLSLLLKAAMVALCLTVAMPSRADIQHSIDSLSAVLPRLEGKEKLNALRNLFQFAVKKNDEELQYKFCDMLRTEAFLQHDDSTATYAWASKLGVMYNYGHGDEVLDSVPAFLDYAKSIKYWERYYFFWSVMGDVYFFRGQCFHALREATAMHEDALKNNSDIGLAWASWELGQVYLGLDVKPVANEYLKKAVDIMKTQKNIDYGALSRAYNRYCGMLLDRHKYEALDTAATEWNAFLDQWEQSLKSQKLSTTATLFHRISMNKYKMTVYLHQGRREEAKALLDRSEEMVKGMSPLTHAKINDMKILYYRSNDADVGKAIAALQEVIEQGKKRKRNNSLIGEYVVLAQLYMQAGEYDKSMECSKVSIAQKDSINSRSLRNSLSEINAIFEIEEQTAEVKQKIRDQKEKSNIIIVVASILLASLLGTYFYNRRRLVKKLTESEKRLSEANEELTVVNSNITEADRMKEVFLLHMGYEVKQPLGEISKFIKQINDPEATSEEDRQKMLTEIQASTNSITAVVNQLLELSDIESKSYFKRKDTVEVTALCQKAIDNSRLDTRPEIKFHFLSLVPRGTMMTTNLTYAAKLITYLINNSLDLTEEGSVELSCTASDGMLRLKVNDTSECIPEERRAHIFETEVNGSNHTNVSDINLAVCKNISHRLGGDVWLEKSTEAGSTFIASLPLEVKK